MIIEWQSGKYLQPNTYIDGGDGYVIGYSGVVSEAVVVICPTPLTLASASSLSALTVAGAGSLDPLTTASAPSLTALPVKLPCVP